MDFVERRVLIGGVFARDFRRFAWLFDRITGFWWGQLIDVEGGVED